MKMRDAQIRMAAKDFADYRKDKGYEKLPSCRAGR